MPAASSLNNSRPCHEGLLILDYGSQYTLLIARRLRELGVYAEVISGTAEASPSQFRVHGIILSGGPDTVGESGARRLPAWVMQQNKPVLGICYGMQLLVEHCGGVLQSGKGREYGDASITLHGGIVGPGGAMLQGLAPTQKVWMSHGDDVASMPDSLQVVATSSSGVVAAVAHRQLPIIGLQFHPEVQHTVAGGAMLSAFAERVCQAPRNWTPDSMLEASCQSIKARVGQGHVLMACSGGVDSTVAAALLAKALGPQKVTAVFCDTGLMRQDEVSWVAHELKVLGLRHIEVLQSREAFVQALAGQQDPEAKRRIIGLKFIEEFETYAKRHREFTHLGQGTLYPDVIESAGHGAGAKVIKSHHNVGGLPEKLHLPLVEPLRFFFKDEVRALGEELGLPHKLVYRHPFPGPGLAVRILGEVNEERLAILRAADAIYIQALHDAGLYDHVWQAFAVLLPVKSVGVMGDNRTYQMTIALRAVTSSDGMTAGVSELPMSFLTQVAATIVQKVHGVNRVVYDITTKPPATIEWE